MLRAVLRRVSSVGLSARLCEGVALVLVRGVSAILSLLPLTAVPAVSRVLGRLLKRSGYRSTLVRSSIEVLPLRDDIEREQVIDAAYSHLGLAIALSLQPPRRDREISSLLEPPSSQFNLLLDDIQLGRGLIFLSAHIGMWELLPLCILPLLPHGTAVSIVYRPLHNRGLDRWILQRRLRHGAKLIPASGSLPQLTSALVKGEVVCILADQRPSDRQCGEQLTFLGRTARFACGAALLHEVTGAPAWFGALVLDEATPTCGRENDKRGKIANGLPRFRLVVECITEYGAMIPQGNAAACSKEGFGDKREGGGMRLSVPTQGQGTNTIGSEPGVSKVVAGRRFVRAYADSLNRLVERHPSQYFWWHRRWGVMT